ncbi:MAG: class I SAM-dependent methyltransferase [Oscillospiraceae bacterium]
MLEKIDKRLSAVASLINKSEYMCDIGTDHAYLPCYLIKSNICKRCFACDINQLPLNSAKKNIEKNGLSDKITTVLSNGLENVNPDFATEIVIAGMGGELISTIIDNWQYSKEENRHFILQPMTKIDILRRYLCENGFEIIREIPVLEENHCYVAMSVYFKNKPFTPSDLFCKIGLIPNEKSENAKKYVKYILDKTTKILHSKSLSKQENISKDEEMFLQLKKIFEEM